MDKSYLQYFKSYEYLESTLSLPYIAALQPQTHFESIIDRVSLMLAEWQVQISSPTLGLLVYADSKVQSLT